MEHAESGVVRRDCNLVYLETLSFQASAFYRALGFTVVFETRGFTPGVVKYTMHKHVATTGTDA